MKFLHLTAFVCLLGILISLGLGYQTLADTRTNTSSPSKGVLYNIGIPSIDGELVPLSRYKGKVLLFVNVASRCGYTPQYKGLEELYQRYRGKGFEILGFPSNDFLGQEPGTDAQIKDYCQRNYGVSFPLFTKGKVTGDSKQPVYRYLIDNAPKGQEGEVSWNFEKILVNKQGDVLERFKPSTDPLAPELLAAIEAALR